MYEGYGPSLLALDPESGDTMDELRCMPLGSSGAIVDLARYRDDLVAVLDRSAVVRIDRSNPKVLMVTESISEMDLGIRPESISVVDGGLFVSGLGGVVRLDTGERFLAGSKVVGRVAPSAHGLVATRQGEILRLSDGASLGRASDLQPLSTGAAGTGALAFVLQGRDAARVGMLDANLAEISGVVVAGEVARVREIGDRLYAVTPAELVSWRIASQGLDDEQHIRVKGALDVDLAAPNTLAVAGTFGRAYYRVATDVRGPGDEFFAAHREPGRLERVLSDGRRIIAGSDEGNWLYMVGGTCEPSDKVIQNINPPNSTSEFGFGTATIEGADADPYTIESAARVVVKSQGRQQVVQMPQGAHARTLANVRDDLWVGHDEGIDVWRMKNGSLERVGRIRVQGPVVNIYPRRTNDGASFVSIFGGMGVVLWRKYDPASPSTPAAQ
ncbi:MAG: hypothetical protein EXS03_00025 [Phycisphaerales bacterium]|nr:hypothetical protein [Phycisphaerales bacterium]